MAAAAKTDCKFVEDELDRLWGSPSPELTPAVREHLHTCDGCGVLWDCFRGEVEAAVVPERLRTKVVDAIQESLTPVASFRSNRVVVMQLLFALAAFAAGAGAVMGFRGIAESGPVQRIGTGSILTAGAVALMISLAWQSRPGSRIRIPWWGAIAIPACGLAAGFGLLFPGKAMEEFWTRGWHCLLTGLIFSGAAAGLFALVTRRGTPLCPTGCGATLGAAGGLAGVAALQLACPFQNAGHLIVWHLSVLVLPALLGAAIGGVVHRLQERQLQRISADISSR